MSPSDFKAIPPESDLPLKASAAMPTDRQADRAERNERFFFIFDLCLIALTIIALLCKIHEFFNFQFSPPAGGFNLQ
jgi:uncharacterized membrane-anchored protein